MPCSMETRQIEVDEPDEPAFNVFRFLVNGVGPPSVNLWVAVAAHRVQENAYQRYNSWRKYSEAMGNPTYLTSFGYSLLLMSFMRTVAVAGEEQARAMGRRGAERFFRGARWLIPIAGAVLNAAYEMVAKPTYTDSLAQDIGAGIVAGVVYLGLEAGTRLVDRRT